MKTRILTLLFLSGCVSAMAQQTIYLDKDARFTENAATASERAVVTSLPNAKLDSVAFYSIDGNLKRISHYTTFTEEPEKRVLHGMTTYKFNGTEQDSLVCNYQNNKRVGKYTSYYPNGQINLVRELGANGRTKRLKQYHPDGSLKRVEEPGQEKLYYDEHGTQILPYIPFEQPATLKTPKRVVEIMLAKEIKYPAEAQKEDVSGRVIIQFLINKEGKAVKVWVRRGLHKAIDQETLRAVSKLVKDIDFNPACEDGQPVEGVFTYPILFR